MQCKEATKTLNFVAVFYRVRSRPKITSLFWRSDLGEIWSVRLSKTAGITGYFEDFVIEERSKMARR